MSKKHSASLKWLLLPLPAALLVACGTVQKQPSTIIADTVRTVPASKPVSGAPVLPKASSGKGGYYQDDGPGDHPPEGLEFTVDPIPVQEAFSRSGNKPYVVFGKTYTPITDSTTPLVQRGIASWYGKKFHGQKTSSGELYDMYKITAAHPTLPIPSYARITNLTNGKQIIVRINDRGPFHSNRIIDLSYTAALKLDILGKGSSQIEVERLLPADIERMAENRQNQSPVSVPVVVAVRAEAPPASSTTPRPEQASMTFDELLTSQGYLAQPAVKANTTAASVPAPASTSLAPDTAASAAVPSAAQAQSTLAAAVSAGNYYLQFGAYAIRSNAESILSYLKNRAESRLPDLNIVQQGSLYRLVSGPFGSRSDAMSALSQAGDLGIGRPLIVQR